MACATASPHGRSLSTDKTEQLLIRLLVVVLSLVAFYFAVFSEASIVGLLLASYGGVAQIFPLMFAAFYWPRATGKGALAGLMAGVGVNVFFLKMPHLKPVADLHEGIYGLVVNVIVLVVVSLLTRPQNEERVRDFVTT